MLIQGFSIIVNAAIIDYDCTLDSHQLIVHSQIDSHQYLHFDLFSNSMKSRNRSIHIFHLLVLWQVTLLALLYGTMYDTFCETSNSSFSARLLLNIIDKYPTGNRMRKIVYPGQTL